MSDPAPLAPGAGFVRRVCGGVAMGLAALLWLLAMRGVLLHDHAGESPNAHEWDVLVAPIVMTTVAVLFLAGLAVFRRWGRWRALAWLLASPLIGWALGMGVLAAGHWINPVPPAF